MRGFGIAYVAARLGMAWLLQDLLSLHPSLAEARGSKDETPLMAAAANPSDGAADCARILLSACPALLERRDSIPDTQITALHYAAANDNSAVLSVLLAAGADVALLDNGRRTPLHVGALNGAPLSVGLLLLSGADPVAADEVRGCSVHEL